jgi:hypothetical protein
MLDFSYMIFAILAVIVILQIVINYVLHSDFDVNGHVLIRNIIIGCICYLYCNTRKVNVIAHGIGLLLPFVHNAWCIILRARDPRRSCSL